MSEMKRYALTYHWHGRMESLIIKATDEINCRKKMKQLHKKRLKFGGEATDAKGGKYSNADFVWLGMKIEQMEQIIHLHSMNGYQVTHFVMNQKLFTRLHGMAKSFPELMPEHLVKIPVETGVLVEEDCIGSRFVKK